MKKKSTSVIITGLIILLVATLWQFASGWTDNSAGAIQSTAWVSESDIQNRTEITLFANDSLAHFVVNGDAKLQEDVDTMLKADYAFEVSSADFSCLKVIWDEKLYRERWDTLAQTKFWRRVMSLPKDSAIINVASSRQIVEVTSLWDWESKGDSLKEIYRDSVRDAFDLGSHAAIYVTVGKSHYYHFDRMLRHIGRGIDVFFARGIDPWYAQAILLIESPGQMQFSPVGAYGSFQLMEEVAIEQGLVVNDSIDEREDFDKAAWAAAGLIKKRCLPQTRRMLRKRGIEFNEDDPFFRMLVLHAYHAGAGNVEGALSQFEPKVGGVSLIQELWKTEYGGFKNASQNYSQVAIASMITLDHIMLQLPDTICQEQEVIAFEGSGVKMEAAAP